MKKIVWSGKLKIYSVKHAFAHEMNGTGQPDMFLVKVENLWQYSVTVHSSAVKI